MSLKFYILIFSIFNFFAFGCLLIYKFVNIPEKVRIERTSVMTSSEKQELVSAVLDVVTNGNFSAVPDSSISTPSRPIAVQGSIYQYNGSFFYSLNGYSFTVGDVFPFDCSRIVAIYKQSLLTDIGSYYVQSSQSSFAPPVKKDTITKDSFGL